MNQFNFFSILFFFSKFDACCAKKNETFNDFTAFQAVKIQDNLL